MKASPPSWGQTEAASAPPTYLLDTSGLAERTYTIIGQGLVDQALSLRAEERRALFEEVFSIHLLTLKSLIERQAKTTGRLQM
jgi:chromosome segregation protein